MIESLKASGDCYIIDYLVVLPLSEHENFPTGGIRAAISFVIDRETSYERHPGGPGACDEPVAAGIRTAKA
jgi:hypothetical protein